MENNRTSEELLKQEFIPLNIDAIRVASEIQEASARRRNEETIISVSYDALDEIHLGLVRLHRSAACVALNGWAPVAPVILRTSLEGVIGALAIVNAARSDLTAFKFFCSYFRIPATGERQEEWQQERRQQTKTMLDRLPNEDQKPTRDFVNAQSDQPGFWYKPDFEGPTDVLERFYPEWLVLYRRYASFAHFGFLAPYFYTEDWTRRDPGPRKEPVQICKVLLESTVLVSKFGQIRANYEGLDDKPLTILMGETERLSQYIR